MVVSYGPQQCRTCRGKGSCGYQWNSLHARHCARCAKPLFQGIAVKDPPLQTAGVWRQDRSSKGAAAKGGGKSAKKGEHKGKGKGKEQTSAPPPVGWDWLSELDEDTWAKVAVAAPDDLKKEMEAKKADANKVAEQPSPEGLVKSTRRECDKANAKLRKARAERDKLQAEAADVVTRAVVARKLVAELEAEHKAAAEKAARALHAMGGYAVPRLAGVGLGDLLAHVAQLLEGDACKDLPQAKVVREGVLAIHGALPEDTGAKEEEAGDDKKEEEEQVAMDDGDAGVAGVVLAPPSLPAGATGGKGTGGERDPDRDRTPRRRFTGKQSDSSGSPGAAAVTEEEWDDYFGQVEQDLLGDDDEENSGGEVRKVFDQLRTEIKKRRQTTQG